MRTIDAERESQRRNAANIGVGAALAGAGIFLMITSGIAFIGLFVVGVVFIGLALAKVF
ncbi:MAG: hypothetical protein V3U17_06555 [Thermoplasmata archaeon]